MSDKQHFVPHSAGTWGMILFLASLFMLFAASMIGYFWIRVTAAGNSALPSIQLPGLLWLSTLLMLGASLAMSATLRSVRREQLAATRRWLWLSLTLGVGFVAVQTPAMLQLLSEHRQMQAAGVRIYGVLFFLVLLHALHVVGGVVALLRVVRGAALRQFDREHHAPVRNAAWYWHFLDIVWIAMFLALWGVG